MAANTPVDELIVEFGGTKVRLWLTESGLVARPFQKSTLFRMSTADLVRLAIYGGDRRRHLSKRQLNHIPRHVKRT